MNKYLTAVLAISLSLSVVGSEEIELDGCDFESGIYRLSITSQKGDTSRTDNLNVTAGCDWNLHHLESINYGAASVETGTFFTFNIKHADETPTLTIKGRDLQIADNKSINGVELPETLEAFITKSFVLTPESETFQFDFAESHYVVSIETK
jgi:hypothetical protein